MQHKSNPKELDVKVSTFKPVDVHYDFGISPFKFEVQRVADPFAIYGGKNHPLDQPNEAYYRFNLEGRKETDILISRLQDEKNTPNDFSRRLREIEGEGDLNTLKEDDDDYESGLQQVIEAVNKRGDEIELEQKAPLTTTQRAKLNAAKEAARVKLNPKNTHKLQIKEAFVKEIEKEFRAIDDKVAKEKFHGSATATATATATAATEDDEDEEDEEEEEEEKVVRKEKDIWVKKMAYVKHKSAIADEYLELRPFLEKLPKNENVKDKHPEFHQRIKQLMKVAKIEGTRDASQALKNAGGYLKHLDEKFKHIMEWVEERLVELERLRKDTKDEGKRRYAPKNTAKPATLGTLKSRSNSLDEADTVAEQLKKMSLH
jgi:hypothetical protein